MYKVEAIKDFTLKEFHKIKNIVRKDKEKPWEIFAGDVFECEKSMRDYLKGENEYKKAFIKDVPLTEGQKTLRKQPIIKSKSIRKRDI